MAPLIRDRRTVSLSVLTLQDFLNLRLTKKSISLPTEVLNECALRCEALGSSPGELPVLPCQVLPTAASLPSPSAAALAAW